MKNHNDRNYNDDLLRKPELSRFLTVSDRTIENWVRQGRIPAIKVGRTILFNRSEVMKALSRFRIGGAE